jgi:hypothetical protein
MGRLGPGSPQVTPSTRRAPRRVLPGHRRIRGKTTQAACRSACGQEAWERPGTSILARPSLCGSGSPGAPAPTYSLSAWTGMLFLGGYTFETPPPLVTPEGIKPFPPTGHASWICERCCRPTSPRRDSGRSPCTTTRHGRCCRRPSGSRGRAARATPLRLPRPTPTGRPPSTWVLRGRRGSPRATGSRPLPGNGCFIILRLYSPLASFLDKTWRPSEVQEVT